MTQKDPSQSQRNQPGISLIASLWNIIGWVVGGAVLGYFIGGKMGDPSTGTLIGAGVGLLYVFYEVYRIIRDLQRKK